MKVFYVFYAYSSIKIHLNPVADLKQTALSSGGEDLLESGQGEGGQAEWGEGPAAGQAPGRVVVGAGVEGGRWVVQQGEHPDEEDEGGRGHRPGQGEEGWGGPPGHVRHIAS